MASAWDRVALSALHGQPRNGVQRQGAHRREGATELQVLEMISLSAVTESYNHRMIEVGRDRWRSCSPTSLLKQCPLEQVIQDCIQVGVEYLQ